MSATASATPLKQSRTYRRPAPRERVQVFDDQMDGDPVRRAEGTYSAHGPGSPGSAGPRVAADVARSGREGEVRRAARNIRCCRQDARGVDTPGPPVWPFETAIAVACHARTSLEERSYSSISARSIPRS